MKHRLPCLNASDILGSQGAQLTSSTLLMNTKECESWLGCRPLSALNGMAKIATCRLRIPLPRLLIPTPNLAHSSSQT